MHCNCCGKFAEDVISICVKRQTIGMDLLDLTGTLCADCHSRMVRALFMTFQITASNPTK